LAFRQEPAEIKPWLGPVRGFSYAREVQPVIDRHCVSCHNGQARPDGAKLCDLRGTVKLTNWSSVTPGNGGAHAGKFSVGYNELQRYVRRPGIESDYHVLAPMEFHADTTDLIQMLRKGHQGVELDAESWDRLITWIDLNCPYHGTWGEEIDRPGRQRERRRDLLKLYANLDDDPEAVPAGAGGTVPSVPPAGGPTPGEIGNRKPSAALPKLATWPFDADEGRRRQAAAPIWRRAVRLEDGSSLDLVLVPAGEFLMGGTAGQPDASQVAAVRVEKPFWMAAREVDNRTYALFDSGHDSGLEDKNTYQFGVRGYPANRPEQPVVRVSWHEAMAFCNWLSARTGERFTLPTEAQWEYACRAGAATPFHFGDLGADFSPHANLADARLSEFASDPYTVDVPLKNPTPFDDWMPKEPRFDDGALLTVASGRYQPNAWGLYDLHGNAAEWTRSLYQPGPGAEEPAQAGAASPRHAHERRVVRGGSWRDVPARATSSFRLGFLPWQRVYNVGFRVISEGPANTMAARAAGR
jgi:formylglycine-generating enzyme required for sulfatase activity